MADGGDVVAPLDLDSLSQLCYHPPGRRESIGRGRASCTRSRGSVRMRIVVNRLPALGIKTGIGHYTAELLAHLREQADDEQIDLFPRGVMWRLRSLASQLSTAPRQPGAGAAPPSWVARRK